MEEAASCLFYKRHVLERGEDGGDDKNIMGGIQAQLHPPVSQTQRSPPRSFSPGFPARS